MKKKHGLRIVLFSVGLLVSATLYSQKNDSKPKVKSVTVMEENYEDDKSGTQQKESFTRFDLQGNIVELIEYDKEGKEKQHILYEYDKEGHKTKETSLKANGNKDKEEVFIYQNGLRTEKIVYYGNGKIKSKKKYIYVFEN